jgi:hypothetical protein
MNGWMNGEWMKWQMQGYENDARSGKDEKTTTEGGSTSEEGKRMENNNARTRHHTGGFS